MKQGRTSNYQPSQRVHGACLRCGVTFRNNKTPKEAHTRVHYARGLCPACYRWAQANGGIEQYAPLDGTGDGTGPKLPTRVDTGDWRAQGNCVDAIFPDLFHPSSSDIDEWTSRAQRDFCGDCPVRVNCFTYAYTKGMEGIWGGFYFGQRGRESKRDDVNDDYDFLAGQGFTRDEIAERLGMRPASLRKRLQRRSA